MIEIIGTLLLIAAVAIPGAWLMKHLMDVLAPRVGIPVSGVIASVIGAAGQLGLGLLLVHLVRFIVPF